MMNETRYLILSILTGSALGGLFYSGLWLTVKKVAASDTPALLLLGSFFLRTSVTILGFYYVTSGSVQRLLLCTLGFVAARLVVIRLTKTMDEKRLQQTKQADHES